MHRFLIYFKISAVQKKPPKPSPSLFSVTLSPLALTRYAKKKKNWTCTICINAWQTNQKDAEYHLRVILMVCRNSDAHKLKKTPATASFKAFWEFCEAGPLWLFSFFFTGCLSFLAIRFSLELETSFLHWSHSPSYTWKSENWVDPPAEEDVTFDRFTRGTVSGHFPSSFYEILVCWKMPCGSFKTSDVCN